MAIQYTMPEVICVAGIVTLFHAPALAEEVVSDHHQPYVKSVATTCHGALHIRTGLHRAPGATTKALERSHVPMRD
jgi:hypothetical protein